jgi:hypothetical protein
MNLYQGVVDKSHQMSFSIFFAIYFLSLRTLRRTSFVAIYNIVETTDIITLVAKSIKTFFCIMHSLYIQTLVVRGNAKERRDRR